MYLKSLEIQGFKSFADKIVLHFNKGQTSVVGPNGSGKSNIADAVRWVLGEQSAKTLRGSKMEDVIFAGTQYRKPVGFAAVTITLDNSDKALPVDFTEVTVSRRVYRSGESEYYLNKTQCRLKDIQELFMNTGVGREGYSIIGQGRIDEILSSKSEERRLVFEEAAGITKYKARKKESERKLETTRQNLVRINDILIELESQLEPLAQQAETARRYIDLSNELKGIEVSLFLDTIDKLKIKLNEVENQTREIREQVDEENRRIENIKNKNRSKNERLELLKTQIDELRNLQHSIDSELEKNEGHIRICEEKINNLTANNENFGNDIDSIKERVSAIESEIEKKRYRFQQMLRDEERFSELLAEAEEIMRGIIARLDEGERLVEEAKQAIMDKQDTLSDSKIRLNNLKNDIENFKQLKSRLAEDMRQSTLEIDRESMKKEDLDTSLRKTREEINSSKNRLNELELKKVEIQKELNEKKAKQESIDRSYSALESRNRVLIDMEESMEGYSRSVKAIQTACQENKAFGQGIHGPVARLITVEERYETAIEVSLGASLQNIVTDDEFAAKRAIEYLKKNNLGRATFLPKSAIKPRTLDENLLAKIQEMPGFEGIASDKVKCSKQFSGIILNLLGRTVIVDNMDSGIRMARQFGFMFRIVTLEGELINAGGSMTGGSTGSKASSIIGRNRVIRENEAELKNISAKLKKIDDEIKVIETELNNISIAYEQEQKVLSELELVRLRDENHVASILDNVKKIAARMNLLKQQEEEVEEQIKEVMTESDKESVKAKAIEDEIQLLKDKVQAGQLKNKDEQQKRDELHTDISDYRVSVNSIRESKQSVLEQIEMLNQEKSSNTMNIAKREEEKKRNLERIEELKAEIQGVLKKNISLKEEKTGCELKLEGLAEERRVLEEELSGMLDRVTEHNSTIITLQEAQGRIEARKAKMESELEIFQNRLWDEYGLTYGGALEIRQEITNVRATQSRINEIKAEIRELGPVNVAAIEDYSKTKERYSFMKNQHDDLIKSEEKLRRVIKEITQVMKKQFVEQFEIINKNFSTVFKELFDGGFAEVRLADEENVLESGIDIIVQPPGKKLQNMMLLSGGEKALVAIALIFAILKMRPAPFYILDEIESSLDDANVYKFAEYLKRYTDELQFIVITHRKGTMEAADILYGVTMEEHGISKVVSLRMDEDIKQYAG
ncbi:MAG TPA: chromosome segregation protein SMC [Clostridiaceae bacterium]|nr:chromosome segregation protein SMC [Clostridiaceae bacterium]